MRELPVDGANYSTSASRYQNAIAVEGLTGLNLVRYRNLSESLWDFTRPVAATVGQPAGFRMPRRPNDDSSRKRIVQIEKTLQCIFIQQDIVIKP